MADLAGMDYFPVTASYLGIVEDTPDFGSNPDLFLPWCGVTCTPSVVDDSVTPPRVDTSVELRLTTMAPPRTLILTPFRNLRLQDGILRLIRNEPNRDNADNPATGGVDESVPVPVPPGVRLLANSGLLGAALAGRKLVYTFTFQPASMGGAEYVYDPVTFLAKAAEVAVDLTTVERYVIPG